MNNTTRMPIASWANTQPQVPEKSASAGDFIDFERLFAMARRQIWVVAAAVALCVLLGIVYLRTTPSTYTANASVLIDEGLNKLVDGTTATTFTVETDTAILSQIEIVKSARLAAVVADAENLTENPAFMEPEPSLLGSIIASARGVLGFFSSRPDGLEGLSESERAAAIKAANRETAIGILQKNLDVGRIGRSNVIALAYTAQSPQLAARITRAYTKAYLADQLDANYDATSQATVWLEGRIAELRKNSQNASMTVEKFRAENGLTAARGELISEQQLSDLNSQLIIAQADTARAKARSDQMDAILAKGQSAAVKEGVVLAEQQAQTTPGAEMQNTTLRQRYIAVSRRLQEVVNAYGEDHPQAALLRDELKNLEPQIYAELQRQAQTFKNEFSVAQARQNSLRESVANAAGQSSQASEAQVKLRELEQQATTLNTLYQTFLSRYEEAAQQQSFPIAKVRAISEAVTPRRPSGPRTIIALGLSVVLGLMLGGALAMLNEFNERFFRTSDDVRDRLGLKFLGYLPLVGANNSRNKGRFGLFKGRRSSHGTGEKNLRIGINAPSSLFAETLRNTKFASDVMLGIGQCRVIGVVSLLPGEGKSTVAANYAGLLASRGARTLLIDGDLRKPALTHRLGLGGAQAGIVEAVMNEQPWQSVAATDNETHLSVIPAVMRGQLTHTSELLSGPAFRRFLDNAKPNLDYIIVDLPPLGPVVDGKAFAPLADGFILVTEWGATPRAMVRSFFQQEPQIAEKLLGVILNKVDLKKLPRYGALGSSEHLFEKYSSYYLDSEEQEAPRRAA